MISMFGRLKRLQVCSFAGRIMFCLTFCLLEDVLHGYNLHSPESLRVVQTSEPG